MTRRSAPALTIITAALIAMSPARAEQRAAPAFRTAVAQAQAQLVAGDLAGAGATVSGLTPGTPFEKYMASSLAMEIAVKRNDVVAQRRAVAQIIESGAAPDAQLGALNRIAGYLSFQTGAIDNAVVYLTRARSLGVTDPQTALMLVESYVRQRKPAEAAQLLDTTIAAQTQAGKPVPPSWYDRASALADARKDWAAMARYDAAKLAVPGATGPDWRTAIGTYIERAQPDPEAQLDLYRLQAATGGMASERDYEAYAQLAAGQGYAAEAKAVVEAGQSTDRLSKTDPIILALMRTLPGKATANLVAIKGLPGKAASVSTGAKAAQAGDSLLAGSQFAAAIPYYRAALERGGADRDRVTTRLGIALARSGDLAGAQTALAQAGGRWSDVARYWSAWVASRQAQQGAPVQGVAAPAQSAP